MVTFCKAIFRLMGWIATPLFEASHHWGTCRAARKPLQRLSATARDYGKSPSQCGLRLPIPPSGIFAQLWVSFSPWKSVP